MSESLAQIRSTMAEIQHFFKGIVFYWRHLYILHLALKMASLFEDDSVDSVTELDRGL